MPRPVRIGDCSLCTVSGAENRIILDPESREASVTYSIGSGCSSREWQSIVVPIGPVPIDAASESIETWLEEQIDLLTKAADGYEGVTRHGSGDYGEWSEAAHAALR